MEFVVTMQWTNKVLNLTINGKRIDGLHGIWTWGWMMADPDEHCDPWKKILFLQNHFYLKIERKTICPMCLSFQSRTITAQVQTRNIRSSRSLIKFFEEGALNYFCTSQYLPTFQTTGKACSRGNGKISDLA